MTSPKRLLVILSLVSLTGLAIMPAGCGSSSDGGSSSGTTKLSDSFVTNCSSCHGTTGAGVIGPSLLGFTRNKAAFQTQVRNGGGGMPAFAASAYSDDDLTVDFAHLISN